MLPRAKKRFGQHFLTDRHYLRRIVDLVDARAGQTIVEIGPGTGLLTEHLAGHGANLHVIEIDRDLAAALRARFAPADVVVHESDALEFDFAALPPPLRLVGNLPYNVSTPILFHVAAVAERLSDCTFMLQREVVDRMVAEPASEAYGRLGVMLQYRFAMDKAIDVPPGAFTPPPKVDSAVVVMRPLPHDRARAADDALFARIVSAAFMQRRKTLRNSTRGLVPVAAWARTGIDPSRRGETLSVAEFISLADVAREISSLQ